MYSVASEKKKFAGKLIIVPLAAPGTESLIGEGEKKSIRLLETSMADVMAMKRNNNRKSGKLKTTAEIITEWRQDLRRIEADNF